MAAIESLGRRHGLNLTGTLSLTAPAAVAAPTPEEAAKAAAEVGDQQVMTAAEQAPTRAPAAAGGAGLDAEQLQTAVDAAVDEIAAALKAKARKAAAAIASKAKKKPRPDRVAKRAVAQAFKAKGGPCGGEAADGKGDADANAADGTAAEGKHEGKREDKPHHKGKKGQHGGRKAPLKGEEGLGRPEDFFKNKFKKG